MSNIINTKFIKKKLYKIFNFVKECVFYFYFIFIFILLIFMLSALIVYFCISVCKVYDFVCVSYEVFCFFDPDFEYFCKDDFWFFITFFFNFFIDSLKLKLGSEGEFYVVYITIFVYLFFMNVFFFYFLNTLEKKGFLKFINILKILVILNYFFFIFFWFFLLLTYPIILLKLNNSFIFFEKFSFPDPFSLDFLTNLFFFPIYFPKILIYFFSNYYYQFLLFIYFNWLSLLVLMIILAYIFLFIYFYIKDKFNK